jgi:hypothetical protein
VVALAQLRMTNSVVVTFVHVIQSDTTCPATSASTNRLVHRLLNRAQLLEKNSDTDPYKIGGLTLGKATSSPLEMSYMANVIRKILQALKDLLQS